MPESQNPAAKTVGFEASTSFLTAVSVEPGGIVSDRHKTGLDRSQEILPQILSFIDKLKAGIGGFDKLGVAVPGLIHREGKRVEYSAHFPEHEKLDLAAEIGSATGHEPLIENDANAAAYGEFVLGAGKGSSDMFYATLGTGVGGALIIGGEIWYGAKGFAGEFGYVAINSDGMRLEEVASTENIVRRTRNRLHQDSTSSLNRLDEGQVDISAIVGAAENDDDFARMMLERTGQYVGTAVANVINLLNIERIVIGGEIMRPEGVVVGAIKARARELSFGPSFSSTTIAEGELGEYAAAIGAALLAAAE